ncbi:MAG: D-amino-acid transaminase [Caulobacteraceae bacterium]
MSRVTYVNGRFVPHAEARVHIEDRGFQFADGVYEVWAVMGGRLADAGGHLARLERSLGELRIAAPMSRGALQIVLAETVRRNRIGEGLVYLQVTRGVARRDHPFPDPAPPPGLVVSAWSVDRAAAEARAAAGVGVITTPETRWARCDIKTTGLLANVLAKQSAREAGAVEAWFVDELGLVTEGGSSNAWIIDASGVLRTRDVQANILRGITRESLLRITRSAGVKLEERPFTVEEAKAAKEAFITGAGTLLTPVVSIDGKAVGEGVPGPVAKRLRQLYIEEARRTAW